MKKLKDYKSEVLDIIETKDWDRAKRSTNKNLYQYVYRNRNDDKNCKIVWEHITRQRNRDYESEILEIIRTKDWDRARSFNNRNLYQYIRYYKDIDENCKIIWEHIKTETRDYESEILEIIRTKDWDRAKRSKDRNLYLYIKCHRDTDENCKTIWEHIKTETRDLKSEILEIIETEDWDRAKKSNDKSLYLYIKRHRDTDENCKIIWEHIKTETRDLKSEILEIIETEDWDRAKGSNDISLYRYIHRHRDTDENCRIIWEHIEARRERLSIKRYLLYYFEHGKPTYISNENLYIWFVKEINKGNQCCIDVKNLIVAADTYKDPIAIETLSLIKNHLEKEDT